MSQKFNRRDFLKLTGAAGATALAVGGTSYSISVSSAQESGPPIEDTTEFFKEFCGIPNPLVPGPGELVVRGIAYPYEDPETGEWFYHRPIRETVYIDIPRTPLTEPVDLMETMPERIESVDGVLKLDLDARMEDLVVNGQTIHARTYNGGFPGPTLVAKPGDVLQVHHTNNMDPEINTGPHDINHPYGFNTINLHTHGINGSPNNNEDNPLLNIRPGETFDYEIYLDEEHITGTFWYHPHKHGATSNHVGSGMAGFLILEDGETDIRTVPEIAAAKEVTLMIQELYIQDNLDGTGYIPDWPTPIEEFYYGPEVRIETTVNGVACNEVQENGDIIIPEIYMRPGEVQHWRVSHAGIFVNFILGIDGHEMHLVANDGITLEETMAQDEFVFTSGQRVDIMVKANMEPGTYAVKRRRYKQAQQINSWPEKTLFNIVVEGEPMDMALPTKLNPPTEKLPYISDDEVVHERKIEMQFVDNTEANLFVHLMDKRLFDPTHVNLSMALGTAETWHVCNGLASDHPFHVHVNWFEIHKVVDVAGNETVYDPPLWADTINVPRGGYATIRQRFYKYQGLSVLHCHLLPHEDEGMMSLIEIVDTTPKTQTITEAGGMLISPEYDNRVMVHFLEKAVDGEAEVTYQYMASPEEPTVNPAPDLALNMADYSRFFSLTVEQDDKALEELNRSAIISVKYSPGQAVAPVPNNDDTPTAEQQVPMSAIKLYHYDEEAGEWSSEGISVISQTGDTITCSTRKLGIFALSGKFSTCYDVTGDRLVDGADIALMSQFLNTPYNYFKGLYDMTGDDEVNGDDLQLLGAKSVDVFDGPYCAE